MFVLLLLFAAACGWATGCAQDRGHHIDLSTAGRAPQDAPGTTRKA